MVETTQDFPKISLSNSFTGLRLATASPSQISKASSVQFVGTIPPKWFLKKSPGVVLDSVAATFNKKSRKSEFSQKIEHSVQLAIADLSKQPATDALNLDTAKLQIDLKSADQQKKLKQKQLQQLQAQNKFQNESKLASSSNKPSSNKSITMTNISPEPLDDDAAQEILSEYQSQKRHHKLHSIHKLAENAVGKGLKKASDLQNDLLLDQKMFLRKFLGKYQVGELVQVQKMLVQVKLISKLGSIELCDISTHNLRILERWKEYFVTIRSTGNIEIPLVIQFYTNRAIKKHDERALKGDLKDTRSRRTSLDFALDINACSVSMLNISDKSIAISIPSNELKNGYRIYVFKTSSQTAAINWHAFIKGALKINPSSLITASVPDLGLQLDLNVSLISFEDFSDHSPQVSLKIFPRGYKIVTKSSVSYVISLLLGKLKEVQDSFPHIANWIEKVNNPDSRLALAWRLYDNLTWVEDSDQNFLPQYAVMSESHVLELRFVTQPQDKVLDPSTGSQFIENPSNIEGFLHLLTSTSGKPYTRNAGKYFYTNDRYLFYCPYNIALPPVYSLYQFKNGIISRKANKPSKIPVIVETNAYELDQDDHFLWLKSDCTPEWFEKHDQICLLQVKRTCYQLANSQGVINLVEIENIEALNEHSFMIKLLTQSSVTIKAESKEVRDKWMTTLAQMSTFWKLKHEEEISRLKFVKETNLSVLGITDYSESKFIEKASQWELKRGMADSNIYNYNSISLLNLVIFSGELYRKSRKHTNFEKYFAILIPGHLLIYKMFTRNAINNTSYVNPSYSKCGDITLKSCYLYTGKLTTSDLLARDRNFDIANPGTHSTPKLYLDGWRSCEEEVYRTFTIWQGKEKFAAPKGMKSKMTSINKLGKKGKTLVFMTRSRQEKDLWVSKILAEIDRFAEDNDFRIVD